MLPLKVKERKQIKTRSLLEPFVTYRSDILRFAEDFDVSFDNNQAEQDIKKCQSQNESCRRFPIKKEGRNIRQNRSVVGIAIKQGKSVFNTIANIFREKNPE
jgi:hypothetical protein